MDLSPTVFEAARAALTGPQSDDLIDHIFRLAVRQNVHPESVASRDLAIDLGWLQSDGATFTSTGRLVADSIREYVFWIERGRKLHLEGQVQYLSEAYYTDKLVLEIGCGFGCNLIPIRRSASSATGVEPNSVYRMMSVVLCEREGLDPLAIVHGKGEALPFADETFDIVLCVSTHQYTDVEALIEEAARVLKPGGELQIVGATLAAYTRGELKAIIDGSFQAVSPCSKTIINTLGYMTTGRRVIGHSVGPSTRYPIYPTQRRMIGWLRSTGLVQMRPLAHAGPETIFIFGKG